MKSNISAFIAAVACILNVTGALARDVTLTVGGAGLTEVSIGTNETAQIVSWFPVGDFTSTRLDIIKDGLTVSFYSGSGIRSVGSTTARIAGPATIRFLASGSNSQLGFCTVQIDPASFPPDKTLVVPAGTAGANIILESSIDLVQWTTAPPGAYTNLQSNMFFRIRADRLP